jgi:hypothetical protein
MRALTCPVAVVIALAGAAVAVPGPAQAAHRPPWHVTIKASKTEVTVGKKVLFVGHVNKSAAGKLVILQERANVDATWKNQRNALVHRDGDYKTHDTPTLNKRRQYRVVMPATKRHKRGVSETVVVDVFKWTSLTTLPAVNEVDFDPVTSVSMNGVSYGSSLEAAIYPYPGAPAAQAVEYNLGHRCPKFRGTFGLSDDSEAGSAATVTASADGTQWLSHTYGLGESDANQITFPTPPLKIRFDSVSEVDGLDGLGAVGSPEVYCEQ